MTRTTTMPPTSPTTRNPVTPRLALLTLALSMLTGCPGYLDQLAWSDDAGRPLGVDLAPMSQVPSLDAGGTLPDAAPPVVNPPAVDAAPPPPPPPPPPMVDAGTAVMDARPGGTQEVGNPMPLACATASEISTKILVPKCGTCHGAQQPAAALDLVTAGSKARMVGVAARGCGAKTLIVAGPPVTGVFFDKLVGSVEGCGGQMPFGAAPLSAAEIECLKRWITP
jgi:hypothetical protein